MFQPRVGRLVGSYGSMDQATTRWSGSGEPAYVAVPRMLPVAPPCVQINGRWTSIGPLLASGTLWRIAWP